MPLRLIHSEPATPTHETITFKVTLRHVAPEVWRRIEVPSEYTFWDLHVAIQDAMGWHDTHLHQFRVEDRRTGVSARIGIPDPDPLEGRIADQPGWLVTLDAWLARSDVSVKYTYDFGDWWEHDVALESRGTRDPTISYPRCLAGERACPPEDCGGPPLYAEMLTAHENPGTEHARGVPGWADRDFDPAAFDVAEVTFDDPAVRLRRVWGK
ncbi:MAG: plasmid pRiA4b ORF-3 family protein [Gemmatimonadales bacterium]